MSCSKPERMGLMVWPMGLAISLFSAGCGETPVCECVCGQGTGATSSVPGSAGSGGSANSGGGGSTPIAQCAALPAATGSVQDVYPADAATLSSIIDNASAGTTIVLHEGDYDVSNQILSFRTANVTLRSATSDPTDVVLDGNYGYNEIVYIAASNVTIADLTLKRAGAHAIHAVPDSGEDISGILIHNVHVIDPGEQGIKVNQYNGNNAVDNSIIECSRIELTDAGRPYISGCYTGGIDMHAAWGWIIRLNHIEGFWCDSGLSEHGIHMWKVSRDTLVERNVIVDCARGIGFGMMASGTGREYPDDPYPNIGYMGHIDGIIRNNFIYAGSSALWASQDGFDTGIALWQAHGTEVYHNTVVSSQPPKTAAEGSIESRYDHTLATLINNLVSHNIVRREGAKNTDESNIIEASLSLFVNSSSGDLHLDSSSASVAIDQGSVLPAGKCDHDIDGETRDTSPDIGADEVQ